MSCGSSGQDSFYPAEACSARSSFIIARTSAGDALGFGALQRFDYGVAELERIYSRPLTAGVGRAILATLETHAVAFGYRSMLADTSLANQPTVDCLRRNGFAPRREHGATDKQDSQNQLVKVFAD